MSASCVSLSLLTSFDGSLFRIFNLHVVSALGILRCKEVHSDSALISRRYAQTWIYLHTTLFCAAVTGFRVVLSVSHPVSASDQVQPRVTDVTAGFLNCYPFKTHRANSQTLYPQQEYQNNPPKHLGCYLDYKSYCDLRSRHTFSFVRDGLEPSTTSVNGYALPRRSLQPTRSAHTQEPLRSGLDFIHLLNYRAN